MPPSYKLSYWEYDSFFKQIDLAVIGSGIVGLSAAINLKQLLPDQEVVIFERGSLPIGASTRNAGFACFGSMTELIDDLSQRSPDEVWGLVEKRFNGLQYLRSLLGDEHLGYEACGGYELFQAKDEAIFEQCHDKMGEFNAVLASITKDPQNFVLSSKTSNAFPGVKNIIFSKAEGSIDTGKMMKSLLDKALDLGVRIYNGISVASLTPNGNSVDLILENGWEVSVSQVLAATNGFSQTLLPDLAILPARNQVLVTKPIPGLSLSGCYHYEQGYYYFRNIHGRVLLGGGRNLDAQTEQTPTFGPNPMIRERLEVMLRELILPNTPYEIDRWWTGILGVGVQKTPILRDMGSGVFVAARLGGMGVAIGAGLGKDAAELMLAARV